MTYIIDLHRLWEGNPATLDKDPIKAIGSFNRVSVVLVTRGEYDLFRSLNTVLSQGFLREVVIVDIGLPDLLRHSLNNFIKDHSRCHVISGREQMGLAHAYNLGSHYCTGDYLFFMTEKALLPKNTLAKLFAFARRKAPPYVIGLQGARHKRDQWIGKFAHFQAVNTEYNIKPNVKKNVALFSHATKVEGDGLFISNRSFSILKGMDENCSDDAMSWDFCLRSHYAGGDVLEAKNIPIEYQMPVAPKSWFKHVRVQWKNYLSWRYFYQKYVSDKTHCLARIGGHAFFFCQFVWDSLLSKSLSKR